jgi:hypothetical protein
MAVPNDPNWAEIVVAIAGVVSAFGTVGVLIAAWFAWLQLKEAKVARLEAETRSVHERRTEALSELSSRWDSDELLKARTWADSNGGAETIAKRLRDLYNASNKIKYYQVLREPNYYENMATMIQLGTIDFRTLQMQFGSTIIGRWERWADAIDYLRTREGGSPTYYENFERLKDWMTTILAASPVDDPNNTSRSPSASLILWTFPDPRHV